MKNTKKSLMLSVISLLLCISMLIGTTFAWFTDYVSTGKNIISSGNIDIEMYWAEDPTGTWYNVEDPQYNTIFSYDNWEPGYTDVKYIKIKNNGSLAANYELAITPDGAIGELAEVINVHYATDGVKISDREDLQKIDCLGLLKNVLNGGAVISGTLMGADQQNPFNPASEIILTLAMNMVTTAGNKYQNKSAGEFSITAIATQAPYEEDSFGAYYDSAAELPIILTHSSVSGDVQNVGNAVAQDVTIAGNGASATIFAGTKLKEGAERATLTVTPLEKTTSDITVVNQEIMIPVDVHVEGVSEENDVPVIVNLGAIMPKYLNLGNYRIYHVEDGKNELMTLVDSVAELTTHNAFTYDPMTGEVSVALQSFSEVTLIADQENAWKGTVAEAFSSGDGSEDRPYLIANADQLAYFNEVISNENEEYGNKHYKLLTDINLGGSENIFYPIGYRAVGGSIATVALDNDAPEAIYIIEEDTITRANNVANKSENWYTYGGAFKGTFDGNGHTIGNFYQNTWAMKGDYDGHYWNDAMGLFGYVYGGTVKNLTIDSFESDGEFTPTGVVAAYAANGATFENIAIINCNPRVYNTGNGGIVGVGGNSSEANDKTMSFTNITIDRTNKISALWGSWDVACGGVMGMFRGYSKVNFTNCHVAAQIDVYNDVCGNYQYYWYRYAGMIIGSLRGRNTTDANGYTVPDMTGITCKDCTVKFDEWNDYYYCELVANTLASYTHDHQMSRLEIVDKVDVDKLQYTVGDSVKDIPKEGRYNFVVLAEGNYSGEMAKCYHFVNGDEWTHDMAGTEIVGGKEILKEDKQHIYLPFNQLFQGDGWGVKHVPYGEFEGVTILERDDKSEIKFNVKANDGFETGSTIKVGDLFEATAEDIKDERVKVFISPVGEDSTADAVYTANAEDWTQGELTFSGTGLAEVIITDYYFCEPTKTLITITEPQEIEKFETKFNNSNFTYRVGNEGAVTLDTIFVALDNLSKDIVDSTVSVTIENIKGNASGTFSANTSDWKKGSVDFNGTGIVSVAIKDENYCIPKVVTLEVIDAVNATSAVSATKNNVVLLKDVESASDISIENGYTFYGNGFELKYTGDGSYRSAAVSYGFITMNGGTLDNIQVKCKIFPKSYLFTIEMSADSSGRYPYGYSAVVATDGSVISNSYIYGARTNVQISGGNVTIEDTVLECGSLANIHHRGTSADTLTLNNVTTIQRKKASDFDSTKEVIGFGVLLGTNESESNAKVSITGDLRQYNWVTDADANNIANTYAKTAISEALKVENYQYQFAGQTAVNMGIVVLNSKNFDVDDQRTNKSEIEYAKQNITMQTYTGKVYSIKKGSNSFSVDSRYNAETDKIIPYTPTKNKAIAPSVIYGNTTTYATLENAFVSGKWVTTLSIDLDNIAGGTYTFKFSDLQVSKYNNVLDYTIIDENGANVDKNTQLTLNQLLTKNYTLCVLDSDNVEHKLPFVIKAQKTSIEPPKFTNAGTATAIRLVDKAGGDWRPAYTVLNGITAEYWSASESKVKTVDLSTLYNSGSISSNVWTYTCDDFTITITGGAVHSDGTKITPVVSNNTLYFASTNKAFGTGTTSRSIILDYVFTDKNASTTWNRTETVKYSDLSEYSYSDFKNGALKEPSSGSGCVTPDTLITLADGSQVRVDSLTGNEQLLVWNLKTGKYESAPIVFVDSDAESEYEIIHLYFSDESEVKVISEHGFFDIDLGKYVYIDAQNYAEYIGHSFVAQGDIAAGEWRVVTLDNVVIEKEITTAWSPVTFEHLCYYTNGILSMPGGIDGLFNIFEVDTDSMRYDEEQMQKDIEEYGLFTLEDFGGMIPEIAFEAFNGDYLKVALGKGMLTWEDIAYMAERYVPLVR